MTAYDHAIQATSGITATTGTETSGPIKVGAPVIDYAVGTTGAFAISAALYQTLRTGKGQHIDMAMLDVAIMLQASHVTDYFHSGHTSKRAGNKMRFPESSMHEASDGLVQLAASNARQHRRFYEAIGEGEEAKRFSIDERHARYDEKHSMIAKKLKEKTAQEWEDYFQSKHVPATRVRELKETLQDPHLKHRGMLHRHENVPGVDKPVTVPLQAFKFKHDGASIQRPPPRLGEHTDEVLASVGYSAKEIAEMRKAGAAA
jgi:crotonobetainyl-CoA:carnitine CoA-transferase CaiB-like acyl-CoA transferase